MKSFRLIIKEILEDENVDNNNGLFATIKSQSNFMRNFNEEILDEEDDFLSSMKKFKNDAMDDHLTFEKHVNRHFPAFRAEQSRASGQDEGSLERHYHNPQNLERHALGVRRYTSDSHIHNNLLWQTYKKAEDHKSGDRKAVIDQYIRPLDRAIRDPYNKTPHELHLYSSTRHDPRVIKNESGIVHHPAFLSTSIDPNVALKRRGNDDINAKESHQHILHIHVPENHPGFYVGGSHKLTGFGWEKEFILPRATKMKYHNTDSFKVGDHNIHLHHLDVIK